MTDKQSDEKVRRIITRITAEGLPEDRLAIEYSFEPPTEGNGYKKKGYFYGIKAIFNKNVPKEVGCNLIVRY